MRRRTALIAVAAVVAAAGGAAALLAGGDGGGEEGATAPPATTERAERTAPERQRRRGRERGDERRDRGDDRAGEDGGSASVAETGPPLDGAVAGARGRRLVVGIADQRLDSWADARLRRLGTRHARLALAWDAALVAPRAVQGWLDAVRAAGAEPLIVFNHRSGERCPARPCRAPTVAQFERSFREFRRRWPEVREFSTWNEPNHASQPVARRPDLVAGYYAALRRRCGTCRVLAADFVADASAARYVGRFTAALGERPRLWGLHNYPDTNRFSEAGTRAFLDLVDGAIWITETGGIVEFTTADGRAVFPYDPRRAARAARWMFRVARISPRIERLYVYQWRKTGPQDRFDAGLIAPDGSARPALGVVRREIARR